MLNSMSPQTIRVTVSEILRKKGMSTREFAARAGIAYNTALSWERGYPTRLDIPTITKICKALEVEPGELFVSVETVT